MPEIPLTPDLVDIMRDGQEASKRRDAAMKYIHDFVMHRGEDAAQELYNLIADTLEERRLTAGQYSDASQPLED